VKASRQTYISHIAVTNADDLGAGPGRRNVLCSSFRLLGITADDASIGTEADHGSGLGTTYCAGSTGHEDDGVVCQRGLAGYSRRGGASKGV